MSILSYFKLSSTPSSPSDIGIGVVATKEANEAVGKVNDRGTSANVVSKKRKATQHSLTRPVRTLQGLHRWFCILSIH